MVFDNIRFADKFGEIKKLEFNNFYCVDCMEILKLMPNKSIDLCIVDPPYGLERYKKADGGNSKKIQCFGDSEKNWNNEKPDNTYFKELFRVSKNQIVWGGNNFDLPQSEYFIIWDKQQFMPSFARCEQAWTNCNVPAKIYSCRSQDIDRIHPTQKPVALYEWLLLNYAHKGDKILDTHVGSASSLIACHKLGFEYIGFELDEDYYKSATARLEAVKSQVSIFNEPEKTEQWEQDKLI